jgi:hypothetical protein
MKARRLATKPNKGNQMKNETMLKHKSGVKFQYVETFTPQFSKQAFVKLLNLKSGKHECFMANTYKQFFTA